MLKELKDTAVHCKTREEYDRLMDLYEKAGWAWTCPEQYRNWEYRKSCHKDVHISVEKTFRQPVGESTTRFYKILSLSQFLKEQGIEEELKVGDWVEVVEDFRETGVAFMKGERFRIADPKKSGSYYYAVSLWVGQEKSGNYEDVWGIYKEHVPNLRKCPPPVQEKPVPFWKKRIPFTRMIVDESLPIFRASHTCIGSDTTYDNMIGTPFSEDSFNKLLYPSPTPSFMSTALKFLKDKMRSAEDRTLIQAGFMDSCSDFTCEGKEALSALLLEKHKPELVALAKEIIEEREKEKKCK